MDIRLETHMRGPEGWGHIQGQRVQETLRQLIETHPEELVIRISLDGIKRTDVPFARSSVVALARNSRGQRGFCLTEVYDQDVLDNWDGAAASLEQPLFVWNNGALFRQLGPEPSVGLREMLQYVLGVSVARTSLAAADLHLQVPNACNKLKALWSKGYILRQEQSAESGGIEYTYLRIV